MKKIVERSANIACYSNIVVASLLCASCLVMDNKQYIETTQDSDSNQIVESEQELIPSSEVKVTSVITTKKTNASVRYTPAKYNEVTGNNLVDYAKKFLGLRYVSGGNSLTNGTDCSGFTKLIFNEFGISLSRSVKEQSTQGTYIRKSDLQKGDLVFYGYGDGIIHHVGIYIGFNQVIHESNRRDGVKITSVNMMEYITSRRIITINDKKNVNEENNELVKENIYTESVFANEESSTPELNDNTIKKEVVEENEFDTEFINENKKENEDVYTSNTYN